MVTWGDSRFGGDASTVLPKLGQRTVVEITGSGKALAARTAEGRVCSWGSEDCGGDCSGVEDWTGSRGPVSPRMKSRGSFSLFNGHMIHMIYPHFQTHVWLFWGVGADFFWG